MNFSLAIKKAATVQLLRETMVSPPSTLHTQGKQNSLPSIFFLSRAFMCVFGDENAFAVS